MSLQRIIVGETDILEGVADGSEAGWNSSLPAINQAVQEPGPELRLDKMGLSVREALYRENRNGTSWREC